MDFFIQIWDKNGAALLRNENAGIGTGNNFDSSYFNINGENKSAWTLPRGQEFYYAEAYSFITGPDTQLYPPVDPTKQTGMIRVTTNPHKRVPTNMWLSCGNQSVCMIPDPDPNYKNAWYWYFDQVCGQGGGNLSVAIGNLRSNHFPKPNVFQMTLQPYDVDSNNLYGQGYRSAVICLGLQRYRTAGDIIIKAGDVQSWVQANQSKLSVNPQGPKGTWIGGLAAYLLYNQYDLGKNYHLEINEEIIEGGCLSCAIATDMADPPDDRYVNIGALLLTGSWSVSGTHRINGFKDGYRDNTTAGAKRQIKCGLLDISTSCNSCNKNQDVAIDVSGPTFAYPGKRLKGAVQLNVFDMFAAGKQTDSVNIRVSKLIRSLKSYNPVKRRNSFGAVRVFDTKMIGGWWDASDGIETMGPGSYFDRNFIHTADDSIKLRAPHVTYYNTTVWQGDSGAAICPTAYGYVNGGVDQCGAYGVFIHRVTQGLRPYHCGANELMQDDDLGGLVSNRTGFSNKWFTPDQSNDLTFTNVNIDDVYVPSLENENQKNANSIGRLCVISAINPASDLSPNVACKATRTSYLPLPTSTKYRISIDLSNCTWDFSGVNFMTSYNQGDQYSSGAIVTGDFNFQAANGAFSDWIPYEFKNGDTNSEMHCQVLPPTIKTK
ncbi:MAG: hypothetical protein GY743_06640 [Planctomycetaceae bacterium]|nr:hypothetical protein [Planctomycetaceae bacterium]